MEVESVESKQTLQNGPLIPLSIPLPDSTPPANNSMETATEETSQPDSVAQVLQLETSSVILPTGVSTLKEVQNVQEVSRFSTSPRL